MQSNPDKQYNRGILLAVIMISSFFNPFMSAAVNIALPRISEEFSMNAVALSWIAMAFLLSSAVLLVPFGKLADILGQEKNAAGRKYRVYRIYPGLRLIRFRGRC